MYQTVIIQYLYNYEESKIAYNNPLIVAFNDGIFAYCSCSFIRSNIPDLFMLTIIITAKIAPPSVLIKNGTTNVNNAAVLFPRKNTATRNDSIPPKRAVPSTSPRYARQSFFP